jgi:hypothetical protein
MFIANSDKLIKIILKTNLTQLMDIECLKICLDDDKAQQKRKNRDDVIKYSANYFMNLFSREKSKDMSEHDI